MSHERLIVDAEISGPRLETYQYEYYSPGCYCTPQIIRRNATPYTCNYLQCYPYCSGTTYVVDGLGCIYYLNEFENNLQVPEGPLPLQTEIIYHYYGQNNEYLRGMRNVFIESDNTDINDHAVEEPNYNEPINHLFYNEHVNINMASGSNSLRHRNSRVMIHNRLHNRNANTRNNQQLHEDSEVRSSVYMAKEGYLVEEPDDDEYEVKSKKELCLDKETAK